MQKNIKDMSLEELEKIELQLWRQREQASVSLQQATNDLQIITNEIASRNESSAPAAEEIEN
jgi:hypothetical protein